MIDDPDFWRRPTGVHRGYAGARFGQVHYRIAEPETPTQTPLMCFHLSPSSGRIYGRLLAEMGRDRIALAPDTAGFGDSDMPPEPPEIADHAAAMGEVLDALEIDEVDLMGYHTGSRIALELAQQRPRQVRRLILVSTSIYTDDELANQRAHYAGRDPDDDGDFLKAAWDGHKKWRSRDAPLIFVHREVAESLRGGANAWWGHRAAFNYLPAENLPLVKQPVFILCPKDDLYEQTLRAADYIANGRLIELPEWGGHGMLDMHTREVAEILRGLLDVPSKGAIASQPPKPAPHPKPGIERGFRKRFVDGPDGHIHLRIAEPFAPEAPPLFCFHSSPNSSRIYETVLRELGKERVVVAPDTPGFGESDAPIDPPEISDYARTMAHVIESFGFDQVDVMGYHTGSETCVELALQRPDLVRRIVMNSAPILSDDEIESYRSTFAAAEIEDDGSHLVDSWTRTVAFSGKWAPREKMAGKFSEELRGGPMSHWGHRAFLNYPLGTKMAEVSQRLLVINLDDDLTEETKRSEGLIRNGRMLTTDMYGHPWFDYFPDEAAQILRGFLDEA